MQKMHQTQGGSHSHSHSKGSKVVTMEIERKKRERNDGTEHNLNSYLIFLVLTTLFLGQVSLKDFGSNELISYSSLYPWGHQEHF